MQWWLRRCIPDTGKVYSLFCSMLDPGQYQGILDPSQSPQRETSPAAAKTGEHTERSSSYVTHESTSRAIELASMTTPATTPANSL